MSESDTSDKVSTPENREAGTIQTDSPINSREEDRLYRWPFAERIARVVGTRSDPSSLVLGIYGPWGDGKTSTISLIKQALAQSPSVVAVDYNPWFFSADQERITRSFFQTIGEALERTGIFSKENIGKTLEKYGGAASILLPGSGEIARSVGKKLLVTEIADYRKQIEAALTKHKRRVVTFIDDVDRLDRREIQTIFKLVRLAGNFPYTAYVLAFDDDVVADALAEAYGSGEKTAGRRFLEKIVQVPLHLPPANPEILKRMVYANIERALAENTIKLEEKDGYEFTSNFESGFLSRLQTPRQVKLYDNGLSFALPLLKGEVNVKDQMLIEAVRIFHPKLYAAIRDNPDAFLRRGGERNRREEKSRAAILIEGALDDTGLEAHEIEELVRGLIEHLFPRTSPSEYGDTWEEVWGREKRICSAEYFSRYSVIAFPTGICQTPS